MIYTIYDKLTGQIEKIINCPENMLTYQFDAKTSRAIEGSFKDTEYYIEDNVPVKIPTSISEFHKFDYTIKQWIDTRTEDSEWQSVRLERERRLQASDWTQLPDVPLATKESWAAYRQALRDITLQADPFNIEWPVAPGN